MITKSDVPTEFLLTNVFYPEFTDLGVNYAIIHLKPILKKQVACARGILDSWGQNQSDISLLNLTFNTSSAYFLKDGASEKLGVEEIENINNVQGGVFVNITLEELDQLEEEFPVTLEDYIVKVWSNSVLFQCYNKYDGTQLKTQSFDITLF